MPELHQIAAAGTAPAMLDAAMDWAADTDYALGCECADPALQIERWGVEEPEGGQPG